MTADLTTFLSDVRNKIESALDRLLNTNSEHLQHRLEEAMRYAVLNGGKRVRPVLCYASAAAVTNQTSALNSEAVMASACSLELIHAYSLVHDDLPAMDNDDLRRGKPTLHIAFGEATAILAGDALQTRAFESLLAANFKTSEDKLECLQQLALASGSEGMCGGQMIDLNAVGQSVGADHLAQMHQLKTGALIRASVLMGALAASAQTNNEAVLAKLTAYAETIGLAFQVKDDILDTTSDTQTLGKRQGADAERNKPTYVSLLGLAGAEKKLEQLRDEAISCLESFDESASTLRDITNYIVQRAD